MLSFAGYRDNDYHIASRDGERRCHLTTFNEEGQFPSLGIDGHPSNDYTYAVTDVSTGPSADIIIARTIVNKGHPLPVGNLDAQDWIVAIKSPHIATGLRAEP